MTKIEQQRSFKNLMYQVGGLLPTNKVTTNKTDDEIQMSIDGEQTAVISTKDTATLSISLNDEKMHKLGINGVQTHRLGELLWAFANVKANERIY